MVVEPFGGLNELSRSRESPPWAPDGDGRPAQLTVSTRTAYPKSATDGSATDGSATMDGQTALVPG